jgi:hypothetical protein
MILHIRNLSRSPTITTFASIKTICKEEILRKKCKQINKNNGVVEKK